MTPVQNFWLRAATMWICLAIGLHLTLIAVQQRESSPFAAAHRMEELFPAIPFVAFSAVMFVTSLRHAQNNVHRTLLGWTGLIVVILTVLMLAI